MNKGLIMSQSNDPHALTAILTRTSQACMDNMRMFKIPTVRAVEQVT